MSKSLGPQRDDPEQTDEGFRVGDVVTRCGDDRQRVVRVRCGDLMEVVCIKGSDIYAVGDEEANLPRRYSYPDELTIDGETRVTTYSSEMGWSEHWVSNGVCVAMKTDIERSMTAQYMAIMDLPSQIRDPYEWCSSSIRSVVAPESMLAFMEAEYDAAVLKHQLAGLYGTKTPSPNPFANRAARRRAAAIARRS